MEVGYLTKFAIYWQVTGLNFDATNKVLLNVWKTVIVAALGNRIQLCKQWSYLRYLVEIKKLCSE